MGDRENCISILSEMDDDAFCESRYKQYETDPAKGKAVNLEDTARQLRIDLL